MRFAILSAVALLSLVTTAHGVENWPEFRGPTADGHAKGSNPPLQFSEMSNVKWKTPMPGKAWSSPVVWEKQVWLTNAYEDGKKLYAVCVDADTGEVLKNMLVFDVPKPQFCHPYNSYASPTPAIEEGRVYVHFGAHGTACIDTKTFDILWTNRELECDHFRGPGSSPIIYKDQLILQFDGFDLQYVAALDKTSGKILWKTPRAINYGTDNGDYKKAYCTPAIIEHDGRQQMICPAAIATEALDPDSGKRLWTVYHDGMNASARPLYGHGLVFITNGMGKMVSVRPNGSGDITADNVAWESGKQIPKKSSLILLGDLLFMMNDSGVCSCVEAKTGKIIWSERLKGQFDASPLYADGRIYFFSKDGKVPVIAAEREYKLLAENELDDGFMASPAVQGDALILRTTSALYRVEK